MLRVHILIVASLGTWPGGDLHAQGTCAQELLQILGAVEDSAKAVAGQAVRTRFEVTTVGAEEGAPSTVEVVEHAVLDDRTVTQHSHFTIYQDRSTKVVVLPLEKQVYLYERRPEDRDVRMDEWRTHSDVIFRYGQVSTCRRYHDHDGRKLHVAFDLPDSLRSMPWASVSYTVDVDRRMPLASHISYRKGAEARSQKVRILEHRLGEADPRLRKSALAQVMTGRKPLSAYSDFEFHDLRRTTKAHEDRPLVP
ncbi:MAG TPA: hypothetical protein PKE21_14145 [Flavobacteriales bacterium]|nr:hypothetical protein [Flavobacteriales bacterium]HMR28619.1 hypothetical protein [Flavobacteriales bacterium]